MIFFRKLFFIFFFFENSTLKIKNIHKRLFFLNSFPWKCFSLQKISFLEFFFFTKVFFFFFFFFEDSTSKKKYLQKIIFLKTFLLCKRKFWSSLLARTYFGPPLKTYESLIILGLGIQQGGPRLGKFIWLCRMLDAKSIAHLLP